MAQIAVIGLGRFGFHAARELQAAGHDVLTGPFGLATGGDRGGGPSPPGATPVYRPGTSKAQRH